MPPPPAIWAISDGRAGNAAMAEGLAGRVAALVGGEVEALVWTPRAPWRWAPPGFWPRGKGVFRALPPGQRPEPPWPALAIGAGRRVAPLVAGLSGRARTAQILNPRMALSAFDHVIAPAHDGLTGVNVINTLGAPHKVDAARLAEPGPHRAMLAALPRPLIAALVGGSTRRRRMDAKAAEALAAALIGLTNEAGASLAVTCSRRTPPEAAALLRERLAALARPAWVWNGDGPNPYFDLLATADALVVTAESVTMASEAAATGKPIFVHDLGDPSPKLAAFHEALAAHGASRALAPGAWGRWSYPPLDETGRAAAILAGVL